MRGLPLCKSRSRSSLDMRRSMTQLLLHGECICDDTISIYLKYHHATWFANATIMANAAVTLSNLFFSFLLLSFLSGKSLEFVNGQRSWCIAKPSSTNATLMGNLDYACSHANCDPLQEGGNCFYPYTRTHHASYAMNAYFQSRGGHISDCDFRKSALIAITDPSLESCTYRGVSSRTRAGSKTWCIAKPIATDNVLIANRDYACNNVDCSILTQGGPCYNPTTLMNHASVAMNLYYQSTGREQSSCDFKNTAVIVTTDPSYDDCVYEFHP